MAGAGAAQTYASNGKNGKVIILEKMARPGRKIMITGKGRCNFTNLKAWNEFSGHVHPKPNFLKPSFYNLSSEKMIDFLTENGMESVVERGDRAFPASHLASDVVDALVRAAESAGAEVLCEKEVRGPRTPETVCVCVCVCVKEVSCGQSYCAPSSRGPLSGQPAHFTEETEVCGQGKGAGSVGPEPLGRGAPCLSPSWVLTCSGRGPAVIRKGLSRALSPGDMSRGTRPLAPLQFSA